MVLLIVVIGLLNICLGFVLAIYYGYGPPGLDGILDAIGPMPPAAPSVQPVVSVGPSAPSNPMAENCSVAAGSGLNELAAAKDPLPGGIITGSSEVLAEEQVLGDVSDLAATAQTAMAAGPVESL